MLPLYKIIAADDAEGMDFMGLVENPAHMKSFIAFSDQTKKQHFFNDDQQIIMGVAIATDMPIYRNSPELGEYNVYFDKEQTRKIGQRLIKNGYFNNVNEQHDPTRVVNGIQLDQIFYIDEARGVKAPDAFKDQRLKDGSMIISYKVEGKDNWSEIKRKIETGEINGFSIEGWFDQTEIQIKKQNKMSKSKLLKLWESFQTKHNMAEAETVEGIVLSWEGDLAKGTELFIMDEEGNLLQAPKETHSIMNEDGSQIVVMVDDNGIVASVEEVSAQEEENEMAEQVEELANDLKELQSKFEAQSKENKEQFEAFRKENAELKESNEKLKEEINERNKVVEELIEELDNPDRVVLRKEEKPKATYRDAVYKSN